MKKLLFTAVITIMCMVINAQTPYYYYYKGEKQYLTLNTRYAFLSLKNNEMPDLPGQYNITFQNLEPDIPDSTNYNGKSISCRYWTELTFEDSLTDKNYLDLLDEIKNIKGASKNPIFFFQ